MIDKLFYYFELFIALCGYNGNNGSSYFGFVVVIISAAIVIYSFYFFVTRMIWQSAADGYPIKHSILDDLPGEYDAD